MRLQSGLDSGAVLFSPGTSAVMKVISSHELQFTGFLWGLWLTDIYYFQFKLMDSPPRPKITEHGPRVKGESGGGMGRLLHSLPLTGLSASTYYVMGLDGARRRGALVLKMLTARRAIKKAQCESVAMRPCGGHENVSLKILTAGSMTD